MDLKSQAFPTFLFRGEKEAKWKNKTNFFTEIFSMCNFSFLCTYQNRICWRQKIPWTYWVSTGTTRFSFQFIWWAGFGKNLKFWCIYDLSVLRQITKNQASRLCLFYYHHPSHLLYWGSLVYAHCCPKAPIVSHSPCFKLFTQLTSNFIKRINVINFKSVQIEHKIGVWKF